MTSLVNDVRYACRMLVKKPGFTAIALLTLAIGIGANTLMFSVVNALAFRPTQVKEPHRLVECQVRNFMGGLHYQAYLELCRDNPVFSDLVAHDRGYNIATLMQKGATRQIRYMHVSGNYFSTLGVMPALGRPFLPQEERPQDQRVAVLSHHFWRQQGADPEVLNKPILLNGVSIQVVGVAPKGFTGTTVTGPDLWVSWNAWTQLRFAGTESREWAMRRPYPASGIKLLGRLKPELSRASALNQMQTLVPRLRAMNPKRCKANCTFAFHPLSRLTPANGENRQQEQFHLIRITVFLMGISAIILLIACLNLANMLTIQGATRHREIAIRMAMGGGRWRIARQLLAESLLLAFLGGLLGLVLAYGGMGVLRLWIDTGQSYRDLSTAFHTGFDARVLVATAGFCMAAVMLFGLKPGIRLTRRDINSDLKASGRRSHRAGRRTEWVLTRNLSLIGQIALSVVLVMGAALFARGAFKATWLDFGFDLDNKLLVKVDPIAAGYTPTRSRELSEELVEHLKTLPGIQTVAMSNSFPLERGGRDGGLLKEYDPSTEIGIPEETFGPPKFVLPFVYHSSAVGADYFQALGIPLLRGRTFGPLDSVPDAEKVVIIDERLARQLRPDGNALGCLIQYDEFFLSSPSRVIGIVPTLGNVSENTCRLLHIYEPLNPAILPANIHIRIAKTEATSAILKRIRAEIRQIDSRLPVVSLTTLADYHRSNDLVRTTTFSARIALVFGVLALFLASLGIYAIKGHMVASRTSEIGIRKALGATQRDLMDMVLREGSILTAIGLLVGLGLGLAGAKISASMLYGINPIDPISILITIAVLATASLLASLVPARRAARIDPTEALRYE